MNSLNWKDTINLGTLLIKNRIVFAALTRLRCNPIDGIPNQLVAKYYAQRAGAGLAFTESSAWSPRGRAFQGSANIYTEQQAQGWKNVVEEVHKKGGLLFLQIYHSGRATSLKINGGYQPWAPSAVSIRREIMFLNEEKGYPVPKQMSLDDIQTTKSEFEKSVQLSKRAGFDGLQIHGANGYLVDQFLRSQTNRRMDNYGGCAQNRCRFALELVDIALRYYQPYRIGLKLSPVLRFNDMCDENPVQTFSLLINQLSQRKIGFVQLVQSQEKEYGTQCADLHIPSKEQIKDVCQTFRPLFKGVIVANCGFTIESGLAKIRSGNCDAISFGINYMSNPDLAERIIAKVPINTSIDPSTFYGNALQDKSKGYTDYPFHNQSST